MGCLSQVFGHGTNGCQPVPGDTNGAGPRTNVILTLPDVVWHQTPAFRWDHSQGESDQ